MLRYVALAVVALSAFACGDAATVQEEPDGPFAVGLIERTFVDTSRPTAANGDVPGRDSRTLVTKIWYPADAEPVEFETPGAPALRGRFPLIVFAHGFTGVSEVYRHLYLGWARRGYVVAAPDFPLSSSRGEGPPVSADYVNQPGDMSFLIDSMLALSADPSGFLGGVIDPDRIGASGQSLGGFTTMGVAFHSCCDDPRIDAAVPMAARLATFPGGEYFTGLNDTPILVVHGDADETVSYEAGRAIFAAAHAPRFLVTIVGGDHILPYVTLPAQPLAVPVHVASVAFFDRYLKGRASALQELLAVDELPSARVESEP